MVETSTTSEIMQKAMMLVKSRGKGALEYANQMLKRTQKTYDKEEQVYWKKIVKQIELLIEGNDPNKNNLL